eukprot:Phypoly_transcript_03244.p1 GENE.Phypoly_transcript_03244~~Phypoly_transcript_03244.p1  ORF type:complete len:742 (+),score=88.29 Phypoly_transcript_03244:221-2446(+)
MSLRLGEKLLLDHVKTLFPNVKVHDNVRKSSSLLHISTGAYLELDIWIPEYSLCFEYQDPYHYVTTWFNHVPRTDVIRKDRAKKEIARRHGLTLVVVPCWWDETESSLVATIDFHAPNLLVPKEPGTAIHLNPPLGYFEASPIPGVGELMAASFPIDPKFNEYISRKTWWVGEKYDGIRCCWNAFHRELCTRTGRVVLLPRSLLSLLPSTTFFDSELWFGRGQFQNSYSLLLGSPLHIFDSVRMLTFDVPNYTFKKRPFEVRYKRLLLSINQEHPFQLVNFRVLCNGRAHLHLLVESIIENGGEGVILRKIGSLYESGRALSLLKLKTAHQSDEEAIVVGFGDHKSINLKLPNGNIFAVPYCDTQVANLKIGDVVTFAHDTSARREVPLNPKIVRLRHDLSWQDVLNNYHKDRSYLNESSIVSGFVARPAGYWTKRNLRLFLEQVAKNRSMDPLVAETWYSIPPEEIRQLPGGASPMSKIRGGFYNIVSSAFPEIQIKKFSSTPWVDVNNRRKFFEDYAAKKGFDPLIAENWYSIRRRDIDVQKGGDTVVMYHGDSVSKALMDLFPNIGLDIYRFRGPLSFWSDPANRRKFFENYAKENNFDPLQPHAWYAQPLSKIAHHERARGVLPHYGESIPRALAELFPDIGIDYSKFVQYVRRDVNNRRQFFERYAKENDFDPLVPENWYYQSRDKILAIKDARKILRKHNSSLSKALVDLFPNIGLERSKFNYMQPARKSATTQV